MRTPVVIERHPGADASPRLAAVGVGFQMDLFIFDRAPQPFDENVVHETSAPVHRNRDASGFKLAGERGAGELRALIGVEYSRLSVPEQSLLQRRDAKRGVNRVRQPPGQNRPAGPINDRHEIQKAARHRDVGDVGRPHVVRLGDRQPTQQIRINLVSRRCFARARARNQRLDPHHAHQPLYPLPVDPATFLIEFEHHPPRAIERKFEMQFIDAAHHRQIVRPSDGLGPVDPRARQVEKRALAAHGQILAREFDHRPALRRAHRPGLLAKKSRSTVNWPILA
jgi:hypothetical protein